MTLAELLWDHVNVTVIDKRDHIEFFLANMKCLVNDCDVNSLFAPYTKVLEGHENKFKYI